MLFAETDALALIPSLWSLRGIYSADRGYLFLQLAQNLYVVNKSLAIPGLFRERFALALGVPMRGDWRVAHNQPALQEHFTEDVQKLEKLWRAHARP